MNYFKVDDHENFELDKKVGELNPLRVIRSTPTLDSCKVLKTLPFLRNVDLNEIFKGMGAYRKELEMELRVSPELSKFDIIRCFLKSVYSRVNQISSKMS